MTKKYDYYWDDCFIDEFEESFYDARSYNPFINQSDYYYHPVHTYEDGSEEASQVVFEFYTPSGQEHQATICNRKIYDIEDEKNYQKILNSIESEHKEIKYFVEDQNYEPCKWYKSIFGKDEGNNYDELFENLSTLIKIPTNELPAIVKNNCKIQVKKINSIVEYLINEKSKSEIPVWQYMAHQEIKYGKIYHPYVHNLLPELGNELYKLQKNPILYQYVEMILKEETYRGFNNK
tara:strand:- start:40 stop:744 length:705 start_codon:yes stop_codon:yes gene_type:complete